MPLVVDIERRELLRKKYSFIVRNRVGKAILDLGILLSTKDETWMAGQWFVLSARSLASSFPFQRGHRRWLYANTDPHCIVYINGEQAKRIFHEVSLPKAIIWEDRRLGTCVWTLGKNALVTSPTQFISWEKNPCPFQGNHTFHKRIYAPNNFVKQILFSRYRYKSSGSTPPTLCLGTEKRPQRSSLPLIH